MLAKLLWNTLCDGAGQYLFSSASHLRLQRNNKQTSDTLYRTFQKFAFFFVILGMSLLSSEEQPLKHAEN